MAETWAESGYYIVHPINHQIHFAPFFLIWQKGKNCKLTSNNLATQPSDSKHSPPVPPLDSHHCPCIFSLPLLHARTSVLSYSLLPTLDLPRVKLGIIQSFPFTLDIESRSRNTYAKHAMHISGKNEPRRGRGIVWGATAAR